MKDSGLPWSPDVPAHWELVPNRAVLRKRKVLVGIRHSAYQLLSLTKAGVIVRDVSTGRGKFSADMGTSQEVRAGDLVFCLFDVPETPRTVGLSKYDGMITGAYTVFECRDKQAARFMEAFYIAMDDRKLLSPLYSGLRHTIPPSVFLGAKTPLPPPDEQAAIVRFLDHADRRIRRYIRAKQKLIKLLEEQKQAIIHRAVTRGLDPDVRLKPSGVEWLGDVPEHWEVKPLKHFVPQVTVGIVVQPASMYVSEGVPCLRSLNISRGFVARSPMVHISPESNAQHRKSMLREGDVVVVRTGRAGVAVVVPADFDGANCIDLLVVRRSLVVESNYLATYLNSWAAKTDVQFRSVGAIQAHYNTATLANMIVAMPPRDEQVRLLRHLDSELLTAVTWQKRVEREVELLHEYRTRLIADVVTGKLDVREAAARLPDEAEDLEPLGETEVEGEAEENEAGDGDGVPEEVET
jgi:type I restriction enzyme S subunit